MINYPESQDKFAELRKQAEKRLAKQEANDVNTLDDAQRLITELQVHQIELEMQNEELRQTHEQLNLEREKYADLYNFAPVAYFIFDDRDIILDLNLAAAELLGNERKYLIDHPLTSYVTPESIQIFAEHRQTVLEKRLPQICEITIRRRDGSFAFVQVRTIALHNTTKGSQLWRSVMSDITERKQAEEKLRVAEEQLRRSHEELEQRVRERTAQVQDLYDNAPVGYHSLDGDGNFIAMNQTELDWLGCTREELLGKHITSIFIPEDEQKFKENFSQFKKTGHINDLVFTVLRKDGSTFPGLVSAIAIYDADGNYISSRITLTDITERKKAEEVLKIANIELERAMRMKDDFLANMSHELRTPLTGILGFTESLLLDTYGKLNERQLRSVKMIEGSGHHLLDLINDILDLAKAEAGKISTHFDLIPVTNICHSSLSFIKQTALAKHISLTPRCEPSSFLMVADQLRLKQILVNLLSNAVKFTPEGGAITLEVRADQQKRMVFFIVQDTGIGIPPQDLARLFKPFIQLDSSLSRQHEGTGLGLALVKRLAALHNGTVSVTSEVGCGSRFTVTIPWRESLSEIGMSEVDK